MNEHEHETAPSHYEKTHLHGRPFLLGLAGFLILLLVAYVVVFGLLRAWSRQPWPRPHAPQPPQETQRWNGRAPQVQVSPERDLARERAAENERLHARHWNDAGHAYATIPIDDAMGLLAGAAARGQMATVLPAPQPATPVELQDQKSHEANPPEVPQP
jgi:hypothetical protein